MNSIIILTKKVILVYNAMKEAKRPHILSVKNETKNVYYQEKYRFCMKGKKYMFEKSYSLLQNIYEQ